MLHKEIPFLRILLPLCAGIITGYYTDPAGWIFTASIIIAATGFLAGRIYNSHISNKVYGGILFLALFSTGLFAFEKEKERISVLPSTEMILSGELSDYPESTANSYRLSLSLTDISINGKVQNADGSVLIYHRKQKGISDFLPGDKLSVKCIPIRIVNRGNPDEFNYEFYMENRGFRYFSFSDSDKIISHSQPESRKINHYALIIRQRLIGMYRELGIKDDRLALVAALTLGEKNMLDPEQKEYFIKAGVMHIMAVSGLHAIILSLFVFRIFFFLKGRLNILRVIITLFILWSFAFITGLTPSVMRATIMFTFLQAGNLLKRPANSLNSVLASAFVLILIRPSVIFDAGFLLSYSAVIFIISFYRKLYLRIHFRHRIPDLIWQAAAVTLIAQAGTLPLTIMLFNRFPVWFLLSNIIIVPLSSLVIIIGCLVPLFYPMKFISLPLAWVLDKLTGLTESLTRLASFIPGSSIENIGITTPVCIFLFITIYLTFIYLLDRKAIPLKIPLLTLLATTVLFSAENIHTRNTGEIITYNSAPVFQTGIRNGRVLYLFSDSLILTKEVQRHTSVRHLKPFLHKTDKSPLLITNHGKKLLITKTISRKDVMDQKPDIMIIPAKAAFYESFVPLDGKPGIIIISPAAGSDRRLYYWLKSVQADSVHFIKSSGAFRAGSVR